MIWMEPVKIIHWGKQIGCGCEPCPHDLWQIFEGAKAFYEDPGFEGTTCHWHRIVKFKRGGRGAHAQVGGEDSIWIQAPSIGLDGEVSIQEAITIGERLGVRR